MTMLVMTMGVSFTTNAQVEIYNGASDEFAGWVGTFDACPSSCGVIYNVQYTTLDMDFGLSASNSSGSIVKKLSGSESFAGLTDFTVEFEKSYGDFYNNIPGGYSLKCFYSLDSITWSQIGNEVSGALDSDVTYSFVATSVTGNGNLQDDIYLKIEFGNVQSDGKISKINVIDPNGQTSSIKENSLNSVNVYSYDKSIFLTSDEYMNAEVTVYNMNGQILNSQNMSLSYSKTEVNLYDMSSGMYIVNISDGTSMTSKKVFIQ